MGKHIIFDSDLYRIELGDGEWVDILERCPQSVKDQASRAMIKASGLTNSGQMDKIEYDIASFNAALLSGMIRAWSFQNKDGKPLPVTPENIGRLSTETSDIILGKINELNPARSKQVKNA
jgi:hypothetical protein